MKIIIEKIHIVAKFNHNVSNNSDINDKHNNSNTKRNKDRVVIISIIIKRPPKKN
jgi:hypothetical protein